MADVLAKAKNGEVIIGGEQEEVIIKGSRVGRCLTVSGLSLLVLYSAPRGFSPQKPTFNLI